MKHDYIQAGVPVTKVAEATGRTVEQTVDEARAIGAFVGCDWRGQPAMSEADAVKLVDGDARRQLENDRAWSAHLAATEQWEVERQRVFMGARQAVLDAAGGDPLPMLLPGQPVPKGPREVAQDAQAAGDRAVQQWERRNPAPTIAGEYTASVWRRVADALTGGGR